MATYHLLETEARSYLQNKGINVPPYRLARSPVEAVKYAGELDYPVVLKVVARALVHKSDVGGVQINLQTPDDVERAYREIMATVAARAPGSPIEGVLVTRHIADALEVIIGTKVDPQFGPVIMFGLGGIFVEVFKDVTFGIAPLSYREAEQMVRNIKGYPLIKGIRGQSRKNEPAIIDLLLQVANLMVQNRELREIDLNPILVTDQEALIADARILLEA
ncbi:MAG: hypothetical protein PWQ18_165 [Clostridia bacterium]|nr:hypothetical protein [Clostridia bacterium]